MLLPSMCRNLTPPVSPMLPAQATTFLRRMRSLTCHPMDSCTSSQVKLGQRGQDRQWEQRYCSFKGPIQALLGGHREWGIRRPGALTCDCGGCLIVRCAWSARACGCPHCVSAVAGR